MDKLLDRFFHYVSFDTQSKANVRHTPSTEGQMKLARELRNEMIELGFDQVAQRQRLRHGHVAWQCRLAGSDHWFHFPFGYCTGLYCETRQSADRRELSWR